MCMPPLPSVIIIWLVCIIWTCIEDAGVHPGHNECGERWLGSLVGFTEPRKLGT